MYVRLFSVNSTIIGFFPFPLSLTRRSVPLTGGSSTWVAIADTDTGEMWEGRDYISEKLRHREEIIARSKERLNTTIEKKTKKKITSAARFSTPFSKHLPSKSEKTPCHYAKSGTTQTDKREPPGNKKKVYTIQKVHSEHMRAKER